MRTPAPLATTSIGSLPHTQLELAVQLALRCDVPAAPQLPSCDRAELMIPQALDGLPGATWEETGVAVIDEAIWLAGSEAFGAALARGLDGDVDPFLPSPTSWRALRPFLWEIEDRRVPLAKVQLAGPLTVRWTARMTDGRPVEAIPLLERHLYQLVFLRALALAKAVKERGSQPVVFLDEPALYAWDRKRPLHVAQLQELRMLVLALQKQGAIVGLHSCSNTDWAAILELGIDWLSVDAGLSLGAVLATGPAFDRFLARGGRLVIGVLPTNSTVDYVVAERVAATLAILGERAKAVLRQSLLAPACGLAMRSVHEADRLHEDLLEARRLLAPLVA